MARLAGAGCRRGWSTSGSTCAAARTCWCRSRPQDVYAEQLEGLWPDLRDRLRDLRDQVGTRAAARRGRRTSCASASASPAGMDAALQAVAEAAQPVFSITGGAQPRVRGRAPRATAGRHADATPRRRRSTQRTMQQSLEIIRRRVDETGTREPSIQRQGADRILVQVPGIGSAEELLADHRQDRAAVASIRWSTAPPTPTSGRASTRWSAVDGRAGRLLRAGAARRGHRRAAGRQPAVLRPERPAGGDLPLQPVGRRGLRRLHRREHRQALRHRARRRGDLGAGDPGAHLRRLGDHHRQLHRRGVDAARDPPARRRAAGGDHRARAAHRRAGARRRTRSAPARVAALVAFAGDHRLHGGWSTASSA